MIPFDYDSAPDRYRAGLRLTRAHGTRSLYEWVASMVASTDAKAVLDVGCGDGDLRAALAGPESSVLVGLDLSETLLGTHPAPVVLADAARLPFAAESFDAVTALNVLYHLDDPLPALSEARRVLRPGGRLLAATIARDDSPEFAGFWSRPRTSFDAEDAPDLVGRIFGTVTVHPWDAPLLSLPDAVSIGEYLRARHATPEVADAASRALPVPLRVTKRGAVVVGLRD